MWTCRTLATYINVDMQDSGHVHVSAPYINVNMWDVH